MRDGELSCDEAAVILTSSVFVCFCVFPSVLGVIASVSAMINDAIIPYVWR